MPLRQIVADGNNRTHSRQGYCRECESVMVGKLTMGLSFFFVANELSVELVRQTINGCVHIVSH